MYTCTHTGMHTHVVKDSCTHTCVYVHTHIHPHNYPPWTLGIKLRSSSFHCKYIHPINLLDSTYGLASEKKSKRRKISDDSIQIWPTVLSSYFNTHTYTRTNTHTCIHTTVLTLLTQNHVKTLTLFFSFFSYNNLSKVYSSSLSPKNLSIYCNSQHFIYLQNSMGQSNLVWQLIVFWANVM